MSESSAPAPVSTPSADSSNAPEAAAPQQESQEEKRGLPQTVKYKANGKMIEEPLEAVLRKVSSYEGVNEKLKQAEQKEKQAHEFQEKFQKNPFKALVETGMSSQDARKFLEDHVVDLIAEEQLDPKDRELKDLKAKIQAQEDAKRIADEEELSKKDRLELEKALYTLDKELSTEFTRSSVLPSNDPFLKAWATDLMRGASQAGYELSTESAVKEVEARYLNNVKEVLGKLDAKTLKQVFGKELVSKIRESDVAAIKSAEAPLQRTVASQPTPKAPSKGQSANAPAESGRKETMAEKMNRLRGHNYSK